VVIPNPVPAAEPSGPRDSAERLVLAIGRLEPQKGFDVLLRAFSTMSARHPDWRLAILGEGSSRAPLEALARELGIAARVVLPGRTPDPRPFLQSAAIFVLSSRFEGFPNALAEAMASGVAVIATDCPTGPRELVQPDASGLLVPTDDVAGMADALERLAADPGLRHRLGEAAREAVRRYHPETVLREWDRLLASVMLETGRPIQKRTEAPIRDGE
jgi:glycosyltransferase involved in cell wall biosynthesis